MSTPPKTELQAKEAAAPKAQKKPEAKPKPPAEAVTSAPKISTEQFLEYQRQQLGDGDVLLVATVHIMTRDQDVCRINVNTTLPMILAAPQLATASGMVEDQLHRTVITPIVGVFQTRSQEANRLLMEDDLAMPPMPDIPRALPPAPPSNDDERERDSPS
jgi:hypothetical protein